MKSAPPVAEDVPDKLYAGARLPLVSFVVVNYNYGRYLRQCVESIFAQTYPLVECIVVDNKSTDDSLQILAVLKTAYPQLKVICEDTNVGQSAACIDGYNLSRGNFVVFVDADDYYIETFTETHLLVQLSSSPPVGFSSSDMLQIVDGAVVGTFMSVKRADEKWLYKIDRGSPPSFADVCAKPSLPSDAPDVVKTPVKSVDPKMRSWVWAPTSGSMYRRDALALFIDSVNLPSLRKSTDAYFNYAINALTGSLLIQRPLAVYRIHGDNQFTRGAALSNLHDTREISDESPLAAKIILRHVMANFDRFAEITEGDVLWRAFNVWSRKAAQARSLNNLLLRSLRAYWRWRTEMIG